MVKWLKGNIVRTRKETVIESMHVVLMLVSYRDLPSDADRQFSHIN